MDARVDDFLNEIDAIKQKEITKSGTKSCDWEECFDDTSGFPYYWNVNTNDVTWEVPADYKKWKAQQKKPKPPRTTEKHPIYKPEPQLFPTLPISQIPDTIIYKIGEILPHKIENKFKSDIAEGKMHFVRKVGGVNKRPTDKRKRHKSPDDSEDEKITLISSYGGDTESENEDEDNKEISRKSKVTLPVKDVQNKNASIIKNTPLTDEQKVTGIALLATYGESDDEEDTKQVVFLQNTNAQNREQVPHQSTLFPIQQLIDASQFDSSSTKPTSKAPLLNSATTTDELKIFVQRKRRIGLELPPNITKKTLPDGKCPITDSPRTGFGFNSTATEKYANFKSAGAIFAKSDVDTPNKMEKADVLKAKLVFLCEGKGELSPVQIMLIQLETLQTARVAGCLQAAYLDQWLHETNGEISNLEKDSTPHGWHLEWDREQTRYSYRHLHTGHTQWEYPNDDPLPDDMDISTTPPPPPHHNTPKDRNTENNAAPLMVEGEFSVIEGVEVEAPPAPTIGRTRPLQPPPPPVLTEADMGGFGNSFANNKTVVPPLPEELPSPPPPPPDELSTPGADKTRNDDVKSECMSTALDSFYSDIAAIESSIVIVNIPEDVQRSETLPIANAADVIPVEVKKRKKMKMSQGLSMKKKGVSKLVEKWKNVQKTLD